MKRMLDLYSGLGGASEAFVDDPDWQVQRIENNILLQDVPHTTIYDVKKLAEEITDGPPIDLIWASPPCLTFSTAYQAPKSKAQRAGEEYQPDLSHVAAALHIMKVVKPRYTVIENVHGSRRDLFPLLGKPRQVIGPFHMWGSFPNIHVPVDFKHEKSQHDVWSSNPLRANIRAKIPYEISQGLLDAIEQQKTLFYFDDV